MTDPVPELTILVRSRGLEAGTSSKSMHVCSDQAAMASRISARMLSSAQAQNKRHQRMDG